MIYRFQAALKKYGVPEEEIFQTADLFERRNIPQVTLCLYALARLVSTQYRPSRLFFLSRDRVLLAKQLAVVIHHWMAVSRSEISLQTVQLIITSKCYCRLVCRT
jgi:hypothetical protein